MLRIITRGQDGIQLVHKSLWSLEVILESQIGKVLELSARTQDSRGVAKDLRQCTRELVTGIRGSPGGKSRQGL